MSENPKVLLLGPLPPPYLGPAIATEMILNSKLKDKFQLIHLNTNTHKTISTLGSWRPSVFFKNAGFYFRLVCLIVRHWPKIVLIPISQTTPGFIKDSIFIIISRLFRRKTILQLRGSNFKNWLAESSRLTRGYVGFILKRTQAMIVLGKSLTSLFSEYYPLEKIFVVPNGANFVVDTLNKKDEKARLLYFGNMLPEKGIEDVLEAMVALQTMKVNRAIESDVLGSWLDSKTRSNCYSMVRDKNLPVVFHHPVSGNKKFKYYSAAGIFVFTPRGPEGHPWVIVEAMAAGLPIISTDQGAISESVLDGVNGFIVEKRNPQAIAEKLKILIENPDLRRKMGRESRRLYEENFTEEKMVERLACVFDTVLKS